MNQKGNKVLVVIIALAIIIVLGVILASKQSEPLENANQENLPSEDAMMEKDSAMKEGDSMMEHEGDVMMEGDKEDEDAMFSIVDEENMSPEDESGESMEQVVEFNISGVNFAYSQEEIRIKQGDKVRINFTSTDGFHDWVVDEFNAATSRVSSGGSTSVEFVADRSGTFEYYCSVGSHRQQGMVGNLIVE